jgi:hypothetical protein
VLVSIEIEVEVQDFGFWCADEFELRRHSGDSLSVWVYAPISTARSSWDNLS